MGIYLFALYLMGCAVNAHIAKAGLTLELNQTPY